MTKFRKNLSVEDLAGLICSTLKNRGIEAVLVGGSVVTIYSNNDYVSRDLDFITHAGRSEIDLALGELGFRRDKGRHYEHPMSEMMVEFPAPPLSIGDESIKDWATRKTRFGTLSLLAPTECVMDRLAAFYHWKDRQALDQAVSVASRHDVKIRRIQAWSAREGFANQFEEFKSALKAARRKK